MRAILGVFTFCLVFRLYVLAADLPTDAPTAIFSSGLSAPHANFTSLAAKKRIDPPSAITLLAKKNGPGVPDDTIVFTFDRVRMAADDVTMAVLAAFKVACGRLSLASGRDDDPVERDFSVKDAWFRLELGWDIHGDRPLLISELYTIIIKLQEVSRQYNMRQVTFKYLLQGRFHAVGRLRNPARPPSPRRVAEGRKYLNVPGGYLTLSDYGRPMDFEVVANAMMGIFHNSWHCMVQFRRSSSNISAGEKGPFTYHDLRKSVKFVVSAPATELSLEEVMDLAYYTAEFGRVFFMEEHQCVFTNTYYPEATEVIGSLSRGVD